MAKKTPKTDSSTAAPATATATADSNDAVSRLEALSQINLTDLRIHARRLEESKRFGVASGVSHRGERRIWYGTADTPTGLMYSEWTHIPVEHLELFVAAANALPTLLELVDTLIAERRVRVRMPPENFAEAVAEEVKPIGLRPGARAGIKLEVQNSILKQQRDSLVKSLTRSNTEYKRLLDVLKLCNTVLTDMLATRQADEIRGYRGEDDE